MNNLATEVRSPSRIKYWRKDITGLRALAVLPVLLFHAFPTLLPGGFYGVDIFFVISGYLISGIIFRGIASNSFSYRDFYIKRIKRIIPNLVTLLAFVAFLGYFILSSKEYEGLGKQIYSSAFFIQNFHLLKHTGDYFATAATEKPLLHLWSLAIEEQFYIVFPIVCTLIWKLTKSVKALACVVLAITFGSFVACMFTKDPSFNFYFPLTRFWELGAGIVLSFAETFNFFDSRRVVRPLRHFCSVVGFLLIVGAMLGYVKTIAAPGFFSLLPVLGAVLLIMAHEDAVINRTLLSCRPMIFIGLISYSLYLWHWPLISYLHLWNFNAPAWQFLVALLVSFPLAITVYYFIENPIRRIKTNKSKVISSCLIGALFLCFAIGQGIRITHGMPNRSIAKALLLPSDFTYPECLVKKQINGVSLYVTNENPFPEILFVGDSHVQQYAERAKLISSQIGKSAAFITGGGCMALVGDSDNQNCAKQSEGVKKLLNDPRIKTVVIGQMWGAHLHERPQAFDGTIDAIRQIAADSTNPRKIFVLLDPPWDNDSYNIMHRVPRNTLIGLNNYFVPYPTLTWWKEGNELVRERLKGEVYFIDAEPYVCPNKQCDLLKYRDDDHLRSSYVKENAHWIDVVFK